MKRGIDLSLALLGLVVASPVLLPVIVLIWLQDRHSPFYIAPRVGKENRLFRMVKLRSMIVDADKSGVDSTSARDGRITPVGRFVRKTKLDEIMQLWNVFRGEMSLVGPRPNVQRETDLYTEEERRLLSVKPGVTDFSSIVFADEAEILRDSSDPDLDYAQLIRPWKSRLGLFYIDHATLAVDLRIVALTALGMISRRRALDGVAAILRRLDADETLVSISRRTDELAPSPPPGASDPVTRREPQHFCAR